MSSSFGYEHLSVVVNKQKLRLGIEVSIRFLAMEILKRLMI